MNQHLLMLPSDNNRRLLRALQPFYIEQTFARLSADLQNTLFIKPGVLSEDQNVLFGQTLLQLVNAVFLDNVFLFKQRLTPAQLVAQMHNQTLITGFTVRVKYLDTLLSQWGQAVCPNDQDQVEESLSRRLLGWISGVYHHCSQTHLNEIIFDMFHELDRYLLINTVQRFRVEVDHELRPILIYSRYPQYEPCYG